METLVFETSLGHAALARQGKRMLALVFGHSSERSAIKALRRSLTAGVNDESSPYSLAEIEFVYPGSDAMVDQVCAFAAGELTSFDGLSIDTSHLTTFGRQVTAACRKIPWGETATYGEIASRVGHPGAARAVGSVMARNRVPLIVPCHRVVPACGGLGGFSAPQGVSMKKRLLEMEQLAVSCS